MKKYFPQIDGLRAIAVIAVIINHISEELIPKGYLGVDIFFVISGFVVTNSLIYKKYSEQSKKKFLIKFYTRRMKRLAPALIFCVFITSFLGLFFVYDGGKSLKTGIYALFGLANFYLWKNGADYFASSTTLNTFTHNWSLGVEEQYYLFYPLLLLLSGVILKYSVKTKQNLLFIIGILGLASFLAYYSYYPDMMSFYSLFTRFWQLAIGGIIAILSINNLMMLKNIKLIFNLNLIFIILILFNSSLNQFQSTALISILTFTLILLVKHNSSYENIFLNNQKTRYLGFLSYSLYLWHWPILSLFRNTIGLSMTSIIFALTLIFIISVLSYTYIEKRFMGIQWTSSGQDFRKGASIIIGLAIFIQLIVSFKLYKRTYLGTYANTSFSVTKNDEIWDYTNCGESLDINLEESKNCYIYKKIDVSKNTIFVYGDSYAQQLVPSLIELTDYYNVFIYTSRACPSWGIRNYLNKGKKCEKYWNYFHGYLKKHMKEQDKLIIANTYSYFTSTGSISYKNEKIPFNKSKKYIATLINNYLKDIKIVTYLVGPIPILMNEPYLCLQPWSKFRDDCKVDKMKSNEVISVFKEIKQIVNVQNARWINLYNHFADISFKDYYNKDHLSVSGVIRIKPILRDILLDEIVEEE